MAILHYPATLRKCINFKVFIILRRSAPRIALSAFDCRMNSTNKYYGTSFVIFEFHSFVQQIQCAMLLKFGTHY